MELNTKKRKVSPNEVDLCDNENDNNNADSDDNSADSDSDAKSDVSNSNNDVNLGEIKQVKKRSQIRRGKPRDFLCSECGKTFVYSYDLKSHSRIHKGENPHLCSTCGKAFLRLASLERHIRTHTGEKPYPCTTCGKAFPQLISLQNHIRIHTGEKPFSCKHCDTRFSDPSALRVHNRTHTGEKPFVCSQCNSTFARNDHLTVHMRTHTGEKPFLCKICGKSFAQSGDLLKHTRLHTGIKPYVCPTCGANFSRSHHLKGHMESFHTEAGQKRKKKKEQRFLRELAKQTKISFNVDTEREVSIDFKCAGQGGNLARLDGAKIREKDFCEIMVDLDENQHKHYPVSCECKRTEGIAQSLMIARPNGKRFHIRINPDAFKVDGKTQQTKYQDRLTKFADVFHNFVLPEGLYFS